MSGERTKKAAVIKALQEFIARRQQRRVLELIGKLEWNAAYDYKAECIAREPPTDVPACGQAGLAAVEFVCVSRYIAVMSPAVKTILERVASWPAEDQEELSELAREIEARRSGVYRMSDEERAAIDAARRGPLASDDEVEAFWKRRGLG